VPTGGSAVFQNGTDVQNIISRVTGSSISNIDGLLKANGTANLFLLNPNGIIFGPNAELNIGGSFVASTASSLKFADGSEFSATNPSAPPLLTVNVPVGLQYGPSPGRIVNQSKVTDSSGFPVGLQVQPSKTLALVGGEVALEGGNLTAPGGRIEVGSVASNSLIRLNPTNKGLDLSYEGVQNFQDIHLSQGAVIDVSDPSGLVGSGDIQVQGRRVTLTDGSQISSITGGSISAGTVEVTASESVELIGTSADDFASNLNTLTLGDGNAGDLRIKTGQLIIRDGAIVSTGSVSQRQNP
jgi:filamentous hemagglutinin family protein